MSRHASWAASWTGLALAAASTCAFAHDRLDVHLSAPNPIVRGDVDVQVDVAIANTTDHAVRLAKSQLPGQLQGPLLRIVREDGSRVDYTGPVVKRVPPKFGDLLVLQPGATLHYKVELTGAYDIEANGRYTLEYDSPGKTDDAADLASTTPLFLWLEGRSGTSAQAARTDLDTFGVRPQAGSIGYTGNCSSSEKSQITSAVSAAGTYANGAYSYLSSTTPSGTQRFVKWFGKYSSSDWSTAKSHYLNEKNAWASAAITVDCSCTDKDTYAYVYPTKPYKIYVCGAFWSAPMTGTDSKGGTFIHEMSHFNVIAGTNDWVYGQSAAANLAKTNPAKALDNADNHEYFAENNPSLP